MRTVSAEHLTGLSDVRKPSVRATVHDTLPVFSDATIYDPGDAYPISQCQFGVDNDKVFIVRYSGTVYRIQYMVVDSIESYSHSSWVTTSIISRGSTVPKCYKLSDNSVRIFFQNSVNGAMSYVDYTYSSGLSSIVETPVISEDPAAIIRISDDEYLLAKLTDYEESYGVEPDVYLALHVLEIGFLDSEYNYTYCSTYNIIDQYIEYETVYSGGLILDFMGSLQAIRYSDDTIFVFLNSGAKFSKGSFIKIMRYADSSTSVSGYVQSILPVDLGENDYFKFSGVNNINGSFYITGVLSLQHIDDLLLVYMKLYDCAFSSGREYIIGKIDNSFLDTSNTKNNDGYIIGGGFYSHDDKIIFIGHSHYFIADSKIIFGEENSEYKQVINRIANVNVGWLDSEKSSLKLTVLDDLDVNIVKPGSELYLEFAYNDEYENVQNFIIEKISVDDKGTYLIDAGSANLSRLETWRSEFPLDFRSTSIASSGELDNMIAIGRGDVWQPKYDDYENFVGMTFRSLTTTYQWNYTFPWGMLVDKNILRTRSGSCKTVFYLSEIVADLTTSDGLDSETLRPLYGIAFKANGYEDSDGKYRFFSYFACVEYETSTKFYLALYKWNYTMPPSWVSYYSEYENLDIISYKVINDQIPDIDSYLTMSVNSTEDKMYIDIDYISGGEEKQASANFNVPKVGYVVGDSGHTDLDNGFIGPMIVNNGTPTRWQRIGGTKVETYTDTLYPIDDVSEYVASHSDTPQLKVGSKFVINNEEEFTVEEQCGFDTWNNGERWDGVKWKNALEDFYALEVVFWTRRIVVPYWLMTSNLDEWYQLEYDDIGIGIDYSYEGCDIMGHYSSGIGPKIFRYRNSYDVLYSYYTEWRGYSTMLPMPYKVSDLDYSYYKLVILHINNGHGGWPPPEDHPSSKLYGGTNVFNEDLNGLLLYCRNVYRWDNSYSYSGDARYPWAEWADRNVAPSGSGSGDGGYEEEDDIHPTNLRLIDMGVYYSINRCYKIMLTDYDAPDPLALVRANDETEDPLISDFYKDHLYTNIGFYLKEQSNRDIYKSVWQQYPVSKYDVNPASRYDVNNLFPKWIIRPGYRVTRSGGPVFVKNDINVIAKWIIYYEVDTESVVVTNVSTTKGADAGINTLEDMLRKLIVLSGGSNLSIEKFYQGVYSCTNGTSWNLANARNDIVFSRSAPGCTVKLKDINNYIGVWASNSDTTSYKYIGIGLYHSGSVYKIRFYNNYITNAHTAWTTLNVSADFELTVQIAFDIVVGKYIGLVFCGDRMVAWHNYDIGVENDIEKVFISGYSTSSCTLDWPLLDLRIDGMYIDEGWNCTSALSEILTNNIIHFRDTQDGTLEVFTEPEFANTSETALEMSVLLGREDKLSGYYNRIHSVGVNEREIYDYDEIIQHGNFFKYRNDSSSDFSVSFYDKMQRDLDESKAMNEIYTYRGAIDLRPEIYDKIYMQMIDENGDIESGVGIITGLSYNIEINEDNVIADMTIEAKKAQ